MTEHMKKAVLEIEIPEGDHCERLVSPKFQCKFMVYEIHDSDIGSVPICTLNDAIEGAPLSFTRAGVRKSMECSKLPSPNDLLLRLT